MSLIVIHKPSAAKDAYELKVGERVVLHSPDKRKGTVKAVGTFTWQSSLTGSKTEPQYTIKWDNGTVSKEIRANVSRVTDSDAQEDR